MLLHGLCWQRGVGSEKSSITPRVCDRLLQGGLGFHHRRIDYEFTPYPLTAATASGIYPLAT